MYLKSMWVLETHIFNSRSYTSEKKSNELQIIVYLSVLFAFLVKENKTGKT